MPQVMKIGFFKGYLVRKVFRGWVQSHRRAKFNASRAAIEGSAFAATAACLRRI